MQATRIVAFGCSITYGHGLSDCYDADGHPGPTPSQYAWPACLGRLANCEVDNQGVAGASNLQILYNILNYNFLPTDLAVIMWSYTDRDMVFDSKEGVIRLGSWQDTPLAKHWMLTHSSYDLAIRSWLYINHAGLFLKSINIPHYNLSTNNRDIDPYKPDFIDDNVFDIKVEQLRQIDKADDKSHPGPNAHNEIAKTIFEIIN